MLIMMIHNVRKIKLDWGLDDINKLDKNLGLDLILHTPGGDIASTESLVNYSRKMFGINIIAVVHSVANITAKLGFKI